MIIFFCYQLKVGHIFTEQIGGPVDEIEQSKHQWKKYS